MAYIINHKEIKDGVIMKTQDNVIYKIMHVIGPEDSWRCCDRLWVIEVRIIKGVNIAYTSNENGLSRDTIFVMSAIDKGKYPTTEQEYRFEKVK